MSRSLNKDFLDTLSNPPPLSMVEQTGANSFLLYIEGPEGTPYHHGRFMFDLVAQPGFPVEPFKLKCRTKVYHPNITNIGSVALDMLRTKWRGNYKIRDVCAAIIELLKNPTVTRTHPDNPHVPDIAKVLRDDPEKFDKTAKEWVRENCYDGWDE